MSEEPSLWGLSGQLSRGRVPGGAWDGCGRARGIQTALCMNWDAYKDSWGRNRVGSGVSRRGRKFRPWVQSQQVLRFQSSPIPPNTVGTAVHKGRRVMKCRETMWLAHYGIDSWIGAPHTRGRGQITGCCQNKHVSTMDNSAFRAAGVQSCLVSWPTISCQTGKAKWAEMKVQGNTQLAVVKVGKCRCITREAVWVQRKGSPTQTKDVKTGTHCSSSKICRLS